MFGNDSLGATVALGLVAALAGCGGAPARAETRAVPAPAGADVRVIVEQGEALPALEPHLVAGKVTVFDFYATWCTPCQKVDAFVYPRLTSDVAIRKINVVDWDTPVAKQWLGSVPELPYLVIYDKQGRRHAAISGGKLRAIDRAIAEARR
jgi:thiol-disulfide isomerase/thioredoxin